MPGSSAQLYFDYIYTGAASQTTGITVLGEAESSNVTVQETIVVGVPLSQMNQLLSVTFKSGETGPTPGSYPDVALDWTAIATPANTQMDSQHFLGVTGSPGNFTDDGGFSVPTLQSVFASPPTPFNYSSTNAAAPHNAVLALIPAEAVKHVDYDGAITVKNAADVTVTQLVGTASLLGNGSSMAGDATYDSREESSAVRSLYLQALAAGKLTQASVGAVDPSQVSAPHQSSFDFQAGDTITVYTRLALTKTRRFIPDTVVDVGMSHTAFKFQVNGTDIVLYTGTDRMISDPAYYTVAWVLQATG